LQAQDLTRVLIFHAEPKPSPGNFRTAARRIQFQED
jgi:hypothetical protein